MADVTLEINNSTPIELLFNETGAFATSRIGCVQLSPSYAGSPTLTAGTEKAVIRIPEELKHYHLYDVGAGVSTHSASGDVVVMIRRVRNNSSQDMLSTPITIEEGEHDSTHAHVQPVINSTHKQVQEGDLIVFDVTSAGSGVRGLAVTFTFIP